MGDGVTDLTRRGLPSSPRMDGYCDQCGLELPDKDVAYAGPPSSRWQWHLTCAPKYIRDMINQHRLEKSNDFQLQESGKGLESSN